MSRKWIICIVSLFILPLYSAVGQHISDKILFKEFSPEFIEKAIADSVNAWRTKHSLTGLEVDPALGKAASSLATSALKPGAKEDQTHQRVLQAGGLHSFVTSKTQEVSVGDKVRVDGVSDRVKIDKYQDVIFVFLQQLRNDKDLRKDLFGRSIYTIGVGVASDDPEGVISACVIFGNQPFIVPDGAKINSSAYGLKPYDRSDCNDLDREYPYLPELLSNNIYVEDGEIYFYFHDLPFLEEVFKESKDGIAIDIVSRNQFSCGTGNRIYPADIHDGVLLRPVYKGKLFRKNEEKDQGEMWTKVASLPEFVDANNTEFNLLLIKNKSVCRSIYYNNIGGENLRMMDLSWALDTVSLTKQTDSVKRVLEFDILFEQGKFEYNLEDIKPFVDSLELHRFNIQKIELTAYSSIEGSEDINTALQKKRAASILSAIENYTVSDIEKEITTRENWEGFMELINDSPYAKEYQKLSRKEIRQRVNSDTLGYSLEPYLRDQRKAHIKIFVEAVYKDSALAEVLIGRFKEAIKKEDINEARAIQSMLINAHFDGNLSKEELTGFTIPQKQKLLPLISNQLALKAMLASKLNDSLLGIINQRFIALKIIDPKNPYLIYNECVIDLYRWSRNPSLIKNPDPLYKKIKKLYSSKIPNYMVSRLLVNFNIIAADFYYDTKKFEERDEALEELRSLLVGADLGPDRTHRIARYFMFQMKLDWAIEVMLPFTEESNRVSEDFLFDFLSIAIYDKEQVSNQKFLDLLERARDMNKKRFCELFGYPNMSFQLLHDQQIKDFYCSSCR